MSQVQIVIELDEATAAQYEGLSAEAAAGVVEAASRAAREAVAEATGRATHTQAPPDGNLREFLRVSQTFSAGLSAGARAELEADLAAWDRARPRT